MNDQLAINTIRMLSVEAIEKANSGHPGLPLGAAPAAYTLWRYILKHNPKNPAWEDRDRFILSAGHGSMLLYSLLHLFGYGVTMEDIKQFRQLGSVTPGHPEYGWTKGVEATTGPLGQGIAMAVGMAMAEAHLAKTYNRPGYSIVDHYTYALCGDGCLMEGISYEAASLAGTLGLGKLIVLYDSNEITIEGSTSIAFTENVRARFDALGWQTIYVKDGNDIEEIGSAIMEAKKDTRRPTLIEIKTKIGYGSPKVGSAQAHGAPLGAEGIEKTREFFRYTEPSFSVPQAVTEELEELTGALEEKENAWNELLEEYKEKYPALYEAYTEAMAGKVDASLFDEDFYRFDKDMATRAYSGEVLNRIARKVPYLMGGSADLAPSNNSAMDGRASFTKESYEGTNVHFGVREHAMAAIGNGLALHGGVIPYVATFLVFSDYAKAAIRLAALMNLNVTYIFTHDSIGVGEDGPTHEPVDQLAMLRSIPGLTVWRPCDGKETSAAWEYAMTNDGPNVLALSRQKLPRLEGTGRDALCGAYVLHDFGDNLKMILMASGSEVALALEVGAMLAQRGYNTRVVSMPSMEVFRKQSEEYKESVLPASMRLRMSIEALSTQPWYEWVGLDGECVGMDTFGASAPAGDLMEHFGFTPEKITERALKLLGDSLK